MKISSSTIIKRSITKNDEKERASDGKKVLKTFSRNKSVTGNMKYFMQSSEI